MKEIKVYKFWAPWCGPCKMLAPVFQRVKEENSDKCDFIEVNADEDENEELIMKFGVRNIPTIIVYDEPNDKVLSMLSGLMNHDTLSKALVEALSKAKDTSETRDESNSKEKDNS